MGTKKQRTLAIFALAIALIATTVAYAALSTTLKVSGTVTKKGGTWNIYISKISNVNKTGTATITKTPTASGTATTAIDFAATLEKPGDSISFDFTVANGGSIDAKIDPSYVGNHWIVNNSYSSTEATATEQNIICKVTYNGSVINLSTNASVLALSAANGSTPTTKTLHASCEYDYNATSVSASDYTMAIKLFLPYVQG